jgi:hypothetical protein
MSNKGVKSMRKRRQKNLKPIYLSITILLLSSIIIAVVNSINESSALEMVVNLVAIFSGISGLTLGISSINSAKLDNVREYFYTGDTKEYSYSRGVIYKYQMYKLETKKSIYSDDFVIQHFDMSGNPILLNRINIEQAISYVSNQFHMWGLLTRKGFLPLWVYEGASGVAVYRLYESSKDVITHIRNTTNPFYAENFEWLYEKIKVVHKEDINTYLNIVNK